MRRSLLLVPLLLALGCTSKAKLEKALADAQALAAEKDSLITEVLETSKFVNSVNEELAKARTALVASVPTTDAGTPAERDRAARAAALERVQALVARLNETEQRLEQSSARARALSGQNKRLVAQIESYKASIDSLQQSALRTEMALRAVIDSQQVRIATLSQELDTTRAMAAGLAATNQALTDTVADLTRYRNTVYYLAGTERELLDKGVVTKEGSKFLFFGGKHLVPARRLDPSLFHALDKTRETAIALPDPEAGYQVVSRHPLEYVDSAVVRDGKIYGQVRITSAEEFWAPSKYLILVQK
jgi:outer membrane murein-binding lipoprotein Lpp